MSEEGLVSEEGPDDLEEEIQTEKKNKVIIFTSRADNIDPYLPPGIGHTPYSKEESIVLKYSHGRKNRREITRCNRQAME
jgi:hypothetical protein